MDLFEFQYHQEYIYKYITLSCHALCTIVLFPFFLFPHLLTEMTKQDMQLDFLTLMMTTSFSIKELPPALFLCPDCPLPLLLIGAQLKCSWQSQGPQLEGRPPISAGAIQGFMYPGPCLVKE